THDNKCGDVLDAHGTQEEQEKSVVRHEGGTGNHHRVHGCRCTDHTPSGHVEFIEGNEVISQQEHHPTCDKSEYVHRYELVAAQVLNEKSPKPVKDQHVEQDVEDSAQVVDECMGYSGPGT